MSGFGKNRFPDDWGTAIGADPEAVTGAPPKRRRKAPDPDTLTGLVLHFASLIPPDLNRIGANVNGPAMMKCFGGLTSKGFTYNEIREMMHAFIKDISRKKLPPHIAPWRAFLADIDKYAHAVRRAPTQEGNSEVEIDDRLQ